MSVRLLVAVAVAGACAVAARSAQACSCADPGPPCRAMLLTDAVFVGKVTEIRDTPVDAQPDENLRAFRRVSFLVEEHFRAAGVKKGGTLEVLTGFGGGDCGYPFVPGERYLVYAQHFPDVDHLFTGICTRTRRVSEAAADLAYLRARHQPDHAAGIEGTIHELARDPRTKDTRVVGPMRGVTVVARRQGDGKRWEARTDAEGWFRIWGLTFGKYEVRAVLPEKFIPEATTRDDVIVESGVCGWVYMLATPWP
jgi:hypothetical protein